MSKTTITINGEHFLINGKKAYSEIEGNNPDVHGLLMNARFIQGIFDDKSGWSRYNRFGRTFNPDKNTEDLIAALPEWYRYGLRAFTVGFMGGGPCFTIKNDTIDNNPFGTDGKTLDPCYAARMDKLIKAADEIGMVVIVSYFYGSQTKKLTTTRAVANAVKTASRFLKEGNYTNVLIEVANELDIQEFSMHPLIYTAEGMSCLIDIAREASGGLPVGCSSGGGGSIYKAVCEASDYILIHGNECSRQRYYKLIEKAREYSPGKPVICNEDSQAIGQLEVAFKTSTSWGYYNNMTKQEPPADWRITKGEDLFFAHRMAEGLGIKVPKIPEEDRYYLQGLEKDMMYEGKRWIRVASLYPEQINYVDFYRNGVLIYTCYDEPFSLFFGGNWVQGAWEETRDDREWKAVIHLRDGRSIERTGEK